MTQNPGNVEPMEFDHDNSLSDATIEDHSHLSYCMVDCKHGRSSDPVEGVSMIQCCLCATWCHTDCVGLGEDEVGVWPCFSCRLMPTQIKSMQQDIAKLLQVNESLTQALANITQLLKQKETNDDDEMQSDEEYDEDDDPEPKGILLIGDSLIRNVKSTSDDFKVESYSGARINDIKKYLRSINPRKTRLMDIYIVCGTNDAASKRPYDRIVNDFKSLLEIAKQRATKVHLSSILPRIDAKVDSKRIDTINQLLFTVTNELDINYVIQDKNFKYRDETVDETLYLPGDGLHLSSQGVLRMLTNFEINNKCQANFGKVSLGSKPVEYRNKPSDAVPSSNAWSSPINITPAPPLQHQTQNSKSTVTSADTILFRGPRHPLSNFFMTPIVIWNITFSSLEHAYNYRKAIEMGQHATAERIRLAPNGYRSMKIAEEVMTDSRWMNMKQSVMYQLLQEKACQCDAFFNYLDTSHGKMLVEDTTHEYWGRGKAHQGLNMLGRLLMTLRDSLDEIKHTFTPPSSQMNTRSRPFPSRADQQVRCYNCGERSHTKDSCRLPSPVQCHACLKTGHKKKFCHLKMSDTQHAHVERT